MKKRKMIKLLKESEFACQSTSKNIKKLISQKVIKIYKWGVTTYNYSAYISELRRLQRRNRKYITWNLCKNVGVRHSNQTKVQVKLGKETMKKPGDKYCEPILWQVCPFGGRKKVMYDQSLIQGWDKEFRCTWCKKVFASDTLIKQKYK